jgi:hypothetical protein
MKARVATALIAIGILAAPEAAQAQERLGDAALGALSGAIFFGPVGAVAGGAVGYTVGPDIANSWGPRHRPARSVRRQQPAQ